MYLLTGVLGFFLCGLFDYNKIKWNIRFFNVFFAVGSALIVFSTAWCAACGDLSALSGPWTAWRILLAALVLASAGALIYALFFALPFDDTYLEAQQVPVVSRGLYALCRHPGFWPFAAFYGFLALLLESPGMGGCFLVFSCANLLYIIVQDRWIFPRYIAGYSAYQARVPFLIPTAESVRRCFQGK